MEYIGQILFPLPSFSPLSLTLPALALTLPTLSSLPPAPAPSHSPLPPTNMSI